MPVRLSLNTYSLAQRTAPVLAALLGAAGFCSFSHFQIFLN